MNWDDVRIVLAVSRCGSFAAAAAALRVDETTIARRARRLERQLGLVLLVRRQGRYSVSTEAQPLLELAQSLDATASELSARAAKTSREPAGLVRVSSTRSIATEILAPRLTSLTVRAPRVRLAIASGNDNVDFARWETDIAIRLKRPEAGDAVMRHAGDLTFAVFGPAGRNAPIDWLGYGAALAHLPEIEVARGMGADQPFTLEADDHATLAAAVATGAGRAILPCVLGDRRADLVRLSPVIVTRPIWVMAQRGLKSSPAVRTVLDWIIESCAERGADDPIPTPQVRSNRRK